MRYDESPAERAIREAMEQGTFDNLPGRGRPLRLDDDAATPVEARLVHRVLKNAGVPPDWIQVRQELVETRAKICAVQDRVGREFERRREAALRPGRDAAARKQRFADWLTGSRRELENLMRRVNSLILTLNVKGPAGAGAEVPYPVDAELLRFDDEFPVPPDVMASPVIEERERAEPETVLKRVMATRWGGRR